MLLWDSTRFLGAGRHTARQRSCFTNIPRGMSEDGRRSTGPGADNGRYAVSVIESRSDVGAPFAMGGRPTLQNIELRCAAHNQYQADLDFGRSFMDAKRGAVATARTFPGECRG
jgi:hypothetical protein